MVGIMVSINNEPACFLPCLPTSIWYTGSEHNTCFVNTNVRWSWFLCWIDTFQEIQYISWRFWFGELCPCNYHTTWCTYGLHTIYSWRNEVISASSYGRWVRLVMWLCILLIFWHLGPCFIWPPQSSPVSTKNMFPVIDQMLFPFVLVPSTGLSTNYFIIVTVCNMTFSSMQILMICTVNPTM
jgi:hypothetical protein